MKIFDYADLGGKHSWNFSVSKPPEKYGIRPIWETDKKVDIGDILIIGNKAYSVCGMQGKADDYYVQCYVKKLKLQEVFVDRKEPKEKEHTDEITCPYCGYEMESWEMDDEEDNYECEECQSTFSYTREVSVTYNSYPVKQSAPIILDEN